MELRLRVGDRPLTVRLVPEGDEFSATVEDASYRVACGSTGRRTTTGGTTVEELALTVDGRSHRVVVARNREHVMVAFDGHVYRFETGDEARAGHEGGAGSGIIIAPMPGKVVSVLVAVGDEVSVGQPVLVLEAMKMESTLPADVTGRVTAVKVVAGAVVGAGETLIEIEPVAE
jgi:acetyl/propionyl-CoA carboxylase alpha subunit